MKYPLKVLTTLFRLLFNRTASTAQQAVDEDDDHRGHCSRSNGVVEMFGERADAVDATVGAVQPVEDGEPPVGVGVVGRRGVGVVADFRPDGLALECVELDPRGLHHVRHPRHGEIRPVRRFLRWSVRRQGHCNERADQQGEYRVKPARAA